MVVSGIKGGLANQIFQWACGKNLSLKYGIPFYLDVSFYDDQTGCTPRKFSLNKFPNLDFDLFNSDKSGFIEIRDSHVFMDLVIEENKNYFLDGYWGSPKYFKENEKEIKKNLSYNSDFIKKVENSRYKKILENKGVSIHVRRTDYLQSNGYHPIQPISYYEKGLEIIGEYDSIYVFSDDIEWCKKNIKFNNTIFVEGFDDIEDLWMMGLCKNNIIANSTFSWWAAFLNENDKKIIAPDNWFGKNSGITNNDLYPLDWINI
jgi:hypothetical protein